MSKTDKSLSPVDVVVRELNGTTRAAEFFAVTPSAVSQWKSAGKLPFFQMRYLMAVRPDIARKAEKFL